MDQAAVILDEVYELIKDPRHWTQGTPARDILEHPVSAGNRAAHAWCLVGAVAKVCDLIENTAWDDGYPLYYLVLQALAEQQECTKGKVMIKDLVAFNDHPNRKHNEVLDLVDRTRKNMRNA